MAVLSAFLILGACQDDLETPYAEKEDQITFSLMRPNSSNISRATDNHTTKLIHGELIEIPGKEAIQLAVEEGKNRQMPFITEDQPLSRGVAYTTSTLNQFQMTALLDDNQLFFEESFSVESQESIPTNRYWPMQPVSFFAYTISQAETKIEPTFTCNGGNYGGSFSYTIPTPSDNSDLVNDAKKQPDIVFAITPNQNKMKEAVPLTFHHALSSIHFKIKTLPEEVTLDTITFSNLYASGVCDFEYISDDSIHFNWSFTGQESKHTFKQLFEENYKDPVSTSVDLNNDQQEKERTFLMIPQEFSKDAAMYISFRIDGVEALDTRHYRIKKLMQDIHKSKDDSNTEPAAWKADVEYTYTLSVPKEVDVEVNDKVEGRVKKGISIRNTGLVTSYIRAMLVGYWVNEKGIVVAPWSLESEEGEMDWGGNWGQGWKKGEDGFYYHLLPIPKDGETTPFFNTYTLKVNPPVAGAKLHLSIVAQTIIAPDDATELALVYEAWPELNK